MKNFQYYFFWFLCVIWFLSVAFAGPEFYFNPTNTQFKLYCTNNIEMYVNSDWKDFNAFNASIKFDEENLDITTWTINANFSNWNNHVQNNLYYVWWATTSLFSGRLELVKFSFVTKNNITWTSLYFVDKNWENPSFWGSTTDDGINIWWGAAVNDEDILEFVKSWTYTFVAYPCDVDTESPTIWNLNKSWTTVNINWMTKILSDQPISFETYDWDSNHKVTHRFSGNNTLNLDNYVQAPNNVDNQEWINSESISVEVSCEKCSTPKSNVNATLNISNWNWTSGKNELTWDSERRWYNVSFDAPFPYEVEKEIVIKVSVSDNANELWTTHTWTKQIKFNSPVPPTISMLEPTNTLFTSPSKNNPLKFYFSDDWAGVDSGTISLEIKEITWENDEIIMTGYVYSGSELSMSLSGWSEWIWNEAKYEVEFYPKRDFPENKIITVVTYAKDLAWNEKTQLFTLMTRQSCEFYGCRESTNVFGFVWTNISRRFNFTWSVLIVSEYVNQWGVEYPYLSGNELVCKSSNRDGLLLTWEVNLYDENNHFLWNSTGYQDNVLYVTGSEILDIYLDENGKVVAKKKN